MAVVSGLNSNESRFSEQIAELINIDDFLAGNDADSLHNNTRELGDALNATGLGQKIQGFEDEHSSLTNLFGGHTGNMERYGELYNKNVPDIDSSSTQGNAPGKKRDRSDGDKNLRQAFNQILIQDALARAEDIARLLEEIHELEEERQVLLAELAELDADIAEQRLRIDEIEIRLEDISDELVELNAQSEELMAEIRQEQQAVVQAIADNQATFDQSVGDLNNKYMEYDSFLTDMEDNWQKATISDLDMPEVFGDDVGDHMIFEDGNGGFVGVKVLYDENGVISGREEVEITNEAAIAKIEQMRDADAALPYEDKKIPIGHEHQLALTRKIADSSYSEDYQNLIDQHAEANALAKEDLAGLDQRLETLQAQIGDAEGQIEEYNQELAEAQVALAESVGDREQILGRIDEINSSIAEAQAGVEALRNQSGELEVTRNDLETQIAHQDKFSELLGENNKISDATMAFDKFLAQQDQGGVDATVDPNATALLAGSNVSQLQIPITGGIGAELGGAAANDANVNADVNGTGQNDDLTLEMTIDPEHLASQMREITAKIADADLSTLSPEQLKALAAEHNLPEGTLERSLADRGIEVQDNSLENYVSAASEHIGPDDLAGKWEEGNAPAPGDAANDHNFGTADKGFGKVDPKLLAQNDLDENQQPNNTLGSTM